MPTVYKRCETCIGTGRLMNHRCCPDCHGGGKIPTMEYTIARCEKCNTPMHCSVTTDNKVVGSWCPTCTPDSEGRLIRAAGDVMRAQRIKGIAKYKSTLEDQNGYTVGGMIDMVAEELADGSVYVQKVREMYLALLDELEAVLAERSANRVLRARAIINRERNRA